jgi:hypothetical protein
MMMGSRVARRTAGVIRLVLYAAVASWAAPVFSQAYDIEPNNSCAEAQSLGAAALPLTLDGSLGIEDVDFFSLSATPGAMLQIDHEGASSGQGTLVDPLLGIFDSECNLIALNDDSGSLNSRVRLAVPPDGILVIAATSYPDFEFFGSWWYEGTYRLTVAEFAAIGSISGRLVDSISGQPLSGDGPPFAEALLLECNESGECNRLAAWSGPADSDGRFSFVTDVQGSPLAVGTYQVSAYASEYRSGRTGLLPVGEAEHLDVGDLPLEPFPLQFGQSHGCTIPPEGGTCRYGIEVRARGLSRFTGQAWSSVWAYHGSELGYTAFQTGRFGATNPMPQPLKLKPGEETTLQFQFDVPGSLPSGAYLCADVLIGEDPHPLFNTVAGRFVFCAEIQADSFVTLPERQGRIRFQELQERMSQKEGARRLPR